MNKEEVLKKITLLQDEYENLAADQDSNVPQNELDVISELRQDILKFGVDILDMEEETREQIIETMVYVQGKMKEQASNKRISNIYDNDNDNSGGIYLDEKK